MPHKVHDSPSTYDSSIRYSVTSVEELHRKDGMTGLYAAFSLPENITEQLSPAQAEFAFAEEEHDKEAQYDRTFDNLVGRRDNGQDETENRNAYVVSPLEPKARAQYFENRIRPKETTVLTARQRALKSAPVIAHLRTNVIIKDEYTLVTDLSHHLSTRYDRPEASIMINVDHSACLLLAGSFEPAYILTISTIPILVQPQLNKRNAALIQSFVAEILSVSPDRGIIRFQPIPEDQLATNCNTILGEIERQEHAQAEELRSEYAGARPGSRTPNGNSMPSNPFKRSVSAGALPLAIGIPPLLPSNTIAYNPAAESDPYTARTEPDEETIAHHQRDQSVGLPQRTSSLRPNRQAEQPHPSNEEQQQQQPQSGQYLTIGLLPSPLPTPSDDVVFELHGSNENIRDSQQEQQQQQGGKSGQANSTTDPHPRPLMSNGRLTTSKSMKDLGLESRRSFWGRKRSGTAGTTDGNHPYGNGTVPFEAPPVPEDSRTTRGLSKRKSLVAFIRR